VSHEQRSLLGRVQHLEFAVVPDLIARIDGAASALRTVMQDHKHLLKTRFEYRDAVKLLQTAAVRGRWTGGALSERSLVGLFFLCVRAGCTIMVPSLLTASRALHLCFAVAVGMNGMRRPTSFSEQAAHATGAPPAAAAATDATDASSPSHRHPSRGPPHKRSGSDVSNGDGRSSGGGAAKARAGGAGGGTDRPGNSGGDEAAAAATIQANVRGHQQRSRTQVRSPIGCGWFCAAPVLRVRCLCVWCACVLACACTRQRTWLCDCGVGARACSL
jgi:hypothetical protein